MTLNTEFKPVEEFNFAINRAERTVQARWLVPLLRLTEGRHWLLHELGVKTSHENAEATHVYHLCFPLRDVFTNDYWQCRKTKNKKLEEQFIAFYNRLFGLPDNFGVEEIWLTAPSGEIRHPGAPGRAGWFDDFLRERIPIKELYDKARNARRMLGTEADVLLLTPEHIVLIECKYKSPLRMEQYHRHIMMGRTLSKRLNKEFAFGLIVEEERDPEHAKIEAPFVLWSSIEEKLLELEGVRGASENQ